MHPLERLGQSLRPARDRHPMHVVPATCCYLLAG